jgi:hypothetical protein
MVHREAGRAAMLNIETSQENPSRAGMDRNCAGKIDVPIGEAQMQAYPHAYNRTAYTHLGNTMNGIVQAG